MVYFFKILVKELLLIKRAKMVGYYEHIDFLPVFNWFKIIEGNYLYLYKKEGLKEYPQFFKSIPEQMLYQFEKLDTKYFEKIHKLAYLRALYHTTKRWDFYNKANALSLELQNEKPAKPPVLNEMVDMIEETYNSIGSIDVMKMSTSRFFSLYYRAIEKIKRQNGYSKEE